MEAACGPGVPLSLSSPHPESSLCWAPIEAAPYTVVLEHTLPAAGMLAFIHCKGPLCWVYI